MNSKMCATTNRAKNWESIDFSLAESYVKKLQMRIVKAWKMSKYGKVKSLQHLLTTSFYAKALAIKRVTENQGKKTSGVDGELWLTSQAKYKAIEINLSLLKECIYQRKMGRKDLSAFLQ